jgi:replicative DNA helicase
MALDRFSDIQGGGRGGYPQRRPYGQGYGGGMGNAPGGGGGIIERIPPQNIEAEKAVLGAMLLDKAAVEKAGEALQRDDFYREAHAHIYDAMLALAEQDEPVDIVTLKDELNRKGILDGVGGLAYLMELADFVPTSANVVYYANIVREKAVLRRLIEAASEIAGLAYGDVDEVDRLVDAAERSIFEVGARRQGKAFAPLRPLLNEAFEKIDTLYHEKGVVTGVDTGFADLNYITSGLQPGDLFILAARPSMGKCLAAWSLIDDPTTGERLTIAECVKRQLPLVANVGACGRVQTARVSHWIDSGVKPVWKVTTRSGRFVEVTGHHPFLTVQGWTPLHDLRVGDRIGVPRHIPTFGRDDSLPLDFVRLLAYLLSSGGVREGAPSFTHSDPDLRADFRSLFLRHFPEGTLREEGSTLRVLRRMGRASEPHRLSQWLTETGAPQTPAFPACVWQWPRRHLAEFVRTLLRCDAVTDADQVTFTSASEQMARDLHHAYVRFGVVATLSHDDGDLWRVTAHAGEVECLVTPDAGTTAVPGDGLKPTNVDQEAATGFASSPDLYWDEITSIEHVGEHQVYDLTVPDGANFIAQDICVHNTSLAMAIGQNAALNTGSSVAVFSLEMGANQLVQRMICSEARVDGNKLRTGFLHDDDWERLAASVNRLWDANIYIDDSTEITAMEMRAKCRRLKAEVGALDLIIVDYLQLMRSSSKNAGNRNEEITEISRGLKNLAREMKAPVIALAQLSRAVERREDKRPMLSDLRDSGAIEAEADVVAFIYRPAYYERKEVMSQEADDEAQQQRRPGEYETEESEVIIAKQRNGPTGTVKLAFMPKFARFDNLAEYREESPF